MELVKGVPITRYCDERRLTPRQRLELLVPVCQAIQHAHQKGIIHRDLKPSNVLVALYDDRPVPKVIDFGVAKATGRQLTEQTLHTGFGAVVGTVEYMSPEQAGFNQLDVDTRSDIYSLGVLLYELLTGSPPFTRKELEKAGMLEMLRVIREQEPSKPSTKLSTAEGLPTLAANRGTEPAKLTKLIRGELDWIVMKCLEKDRNRRYETANGLAHDVERYLNDEAVQACPPSAGYRLRKFLRRNRGAVIAACVILLCLLVGIVATSSALVWALRERDAKARALVAETEDRESKEKALARESKEREAKEKALAAEKRALAVEKQARQTAMAALRATTDEIVENQMARGTQLSEENKEFLRKIIKHYEGFAEITGDDAESRAIRAEGYGSVALMRHKLGEFKDAGTAYAAELALRQQLVADFPGRPEFRENLARNENRLGNLLLSTGRLPEAEKSYRDALAIQKQLADDFPTRPELRHGRAMSLHNLGLLLGRTGRPEAGAMLDDALAILMRLVDECPERPEFRQTLATSYDSLGLRLGSSGRPEEAIAAHTAALGLWEQLTTELPRRAEFRQKLAESHQNKGARLREMNRLKDAETAYGDALAILKQLAAEFHSRPEFRNSLASAHLWLGQLLRDTRRLKEAEKAYADAIVLQKELADDFPKVPEYRQLLAKSKCDLGLLLRYAGRPKEAEEAYADALALQKQLAADFPMRHDFSQDLARSHNDRGFLLFTMGRLREADEGYAAALALRKQAAEKFPGEPEVRNDLAGTCVNLAILHLEQRDFKAAKANLEQAVPHHKSALKAKPRHPIYRQFYRNNLAVRIQTNAGLGDTAEAKQAAQTLSDLGWDPPGNAYDAACALSL
jgi:tetratricopeptide (TPR) repeat protein